VEIVAKLIKVLRTELTPEELKKVITNVEPRKTRKEDSGEYKKRGYDESGKTDIRPTKKRFEDVRPYSPDK
jgi:transposase